MTDEEFWLPLVEEPIGELVAQIQEGDPELGALASSPRRQLAFRTFAYIRVGVLLGTLLVDTDVDTVSKSTWVDTRGTWIRPWGPVTHVDCLLKNSGNPGSSRPVSAMCSA